MRDRFDSDFSAVRLHEGNGANAAARSINARAFTSGTHIVFGQDVQLHSDSGRAVLRHELAHVIQQSRGQNPARWLDDGPNDPLERSAERAAGQTLPAFTISDQPKHDRFPRSATSRQGSKVTAGSATAAATVQRQERRAAGGPAVFASRPCAIDVRQLTNSELLLQLNRARVFIAAHEPCEGECYDYANLFRRLSAERYRRAGLGHIWLNTPGLLTIPEQLYLLSSAGAEQLRVSEISGSYADANTPNGAVLLTVAQFHTFLDEHGFPILDLHDEPGIFFDPETRALGHANWTTLLSTNPTAIAGADLSSRILWLPPFDFGMNSPAVADATAISPATRPTFLGGAPRSALGWPGAAAGPFPMLPLTGTPLGGEPNLPMPGDESLSGSTPAWALQQIRDAPGRYTPGGGERIYFAPPEVSAQSSQPFPFHPFVAPGGDEGWDPASMGAASVSPLGRPPVLPEGATGVMWEGSHTSNVASLHGRMVARGFRAGYARHAWSDLERMSGYRLGSNATSSLNVGTAGSYANDALFPLAGETLHGFGAPEHWSGRGAVVVYRADGTPATAAQILELMGGAQTAMAGESYRFSPPPPGSRPDAFATEYARRQGLPWPCGGARMCVNLPLDAPNVPDVHTAALGTPMVYTDESGNLIDLRDPTQATARRMSEFMSLPDEYFEARGLRRVRVGSSVMRGYGVAGALGGVTTMGMDLVSGNVDEGTVRRGAIGLGTGVAGAVAEDYASTAITTRLARSMPGRMASGFGRVGAATGVGIALAPVATGLEMYFDDRRYTSIDYAARMGRSTATAAVGAGGGALAIIGVSTLAGSEVPIIGNAIGFVVGVGLAMLTDAAVGEEIEEGIRVRLGERGCPGTPYAND